jgi:GTP cyclohydrolase I
MKVTGAKGVIVYGDAIHTCMISRGIEEHDSSTITVATRGVFRDDKKLEQKFLTAIGVK